MRIYIFSGEGSSFAIISQLRIPLTVFFLLSLFSLPIDYTRLRMWEIRIRKFGRVFLFRTSPLPVLSKLSRCAITAVANLIKGHPLIHVTRVSVGTMFLSPSLLSYYREKKTKEFFSFLKLHRYTSPRKMMDFSFGKESASLSSSRYFE